MVDQLFGSKTRVKLLKFFFANQDEEFFVRELTRLLDEQINSIRRELINLSEAGVVKSSEKENKVYYSLNKEGAMYEGLDKILAPTAEASAGDAKKVKAGKVVGSGSSSNDKKGIIVKDAKLNLIKEELSSVEGVKLIIAAGVLLKNAVRGVDLLVVGNFNNKSSEEVKEKIALIEKKLNKTISFVVIEEDAYIYRVKINDRFIMSVLQSKNEILLDEIKV
jgi:DNA-binding transcriptional ArsR family regulator